MLPLDLGMHFQIALLLPFVSADVLGEKYLLMFLAVENSTYGGIVAICFST
jgi:hypothetical protein